MSLQAIYDAIPGIKCQRKCQEACGPIGLSMAEAARIERHGVKTKKAAGMALLVGRASLACPLLGALGDCTAYDDRPLICRLWGVVDDLRCEWGCVPDHYLTRADARNLFQRAQKVKP